MEPEIITNIVPRYRPQPFDKGEHYLSRVRNFQFRPLTDTNHLIETDEGIELARCAQFMHKSDENMSSRVFFFTDDEELIRILSRTSSTLFLYGACGETNALHLRVSGEYYFRG